MLKFWLSVGSLLVLIGSLLSMEHVSSVILLVINTLLVAFWLYFERRKTFLNVVVLALVGVGILLADVRDLIDLHSYANFGLVPFWLVPAAFSFILSASTLFNALADWLVDPFKQLKDEELPEKPKKLARLRNEALIYDSILVLVLVLAPGFLKQHTVPMLSLALVLFFMRWLIGSWRSRLRLVLGCLTVYLVAWLGVYIEVWQFGFGDFGPAPIWFAITVGVILEVLVGLQNYWKETI